MAQEITLERLSYVEPGPTPNGEGEGNGWSLLAEWDVSQSSGFKAFQLQAYADARLEEPVGDPVAVSGSSRGSWSPASANVNLDPAQEYWLAVESTQGRKATSNGLAVLWQAPGITASLFAGSSLDLRWTPPPAPKPSAYRLSIDDPAGSPVVEESLTSPGYPIPDSNQRCWRCDLGGMPEDLVAEELAIALRPIAQATSGISIGPAGIAPVYTRSPQLLRTQWQNGGVRQSPVGYELTVLNQGFGTTDPPRFATVAYVDGLLRYGPELLQSRFDSDGNCAIDLELPVGKLPLTGELTVSVARSDGLARSPYSGAMALPAERPAITSAHYDGSSACVEWTPCAGATGYLVSVVEADGSSPVSQQTVGDVTRASFELSLTDLTQTFQVVVQALLPGAGVPSDPAPLFEPSYFTATAKEPVPHLFAATSLADLGTTHQDIAVALPDLGGGTPLSGLPLSEGPFTLSGPEPSSPALPYRLQISSEAWSFPEPVRAGPWKQYLAFLEGAEKAGAKALGVAVLQQAVSRHLPQTFAETLLYAYGFDLAAGTVDLRPGMVLRISFDRYGSIPGASTWLTGYGGGPAVDCDVSGYLDPTGGWLLGLDAFFARLAAAGALEVEQPQGSPSAQTEAGVAGVADLFYGSFRQPFYRLFLPSKLQSPTSVGSARPAANFALAAAPTYTALTAATSQPTANGTTAYFRGRAVLTPCIRVTLDGTELTVPVGTTVRNLLEQRGVAPPTAEIPLEGLALERALGPAVLDPSRPYAVGEAYPVRLQNGVLPVYRSGSDALALPLLHGDRLATSAA